jgi:hypothetical protein
LEIFPILYLFYSIRIVEKITKNNLLRDKTYRMDSE